ncbi:hypothetical protein [Desulfovibrio sp. ZJ369]|uniref:hypothetical protein n=1 Tax=Desulfovibrio sp. ZJ369 TaxID=2709793 RepID=UPI0013ECF602|nr:hypothetical protein [Desulfovibrio sp. ZJ369]
MPSPHLAVYLAARSLLYFRHVLSHLPADEVDILVPRALCADQNPPNPTLAALRGQGYAVLPDDAARGPYGALAVAGVPDLLNHPHLSLLAERRVLMLHATTFLPRLAHAEYSHFLCMYERQARQAAGAAARPPSGRAENAQAVQEFAHAGLYQLGEWETRRHEDKNALRRELAQGLNIAIPCGKRIVFYCGGLLDCPQEQIRTVLHLSRHYFVIFKPYYFLPEHQILLGAPSTATIQDTLTIAPGCMRFAADVILASPLSGVFTTCLMLGLAVLPLLTEHQALPQARETFVPWQNALAAHNEEQRLAGLLGGVFSTDRLPALEKRMEDGVYWRKYTQCLPLVQRKFFGRYATEGAARYAARLLLRVALRGSFGPDTFLRRPRPAGSA